MEIIEEDILFTPAQKRFFASDDCNEARKALGRLVENPNYRSSLARPDESTEDFVERHLQYLSRHPLVKYEGYISNLKLMTSSKKRS